MKKLLPYVKYELKTDKTIDEVRDRLAANVDIRKPFFNFSYPKNMFHGKLEQNTFKISKTIKRQRNSFNPVIVGELKEDRESTSIRVKMRLDHAVLIFMILWLSGTGFLGVGVLIAGFLFGNFEGFLIIPLGMFCFGVALTLIAFHAGKKKSLEALKEILTAEEVDVSGNDANSPIQRF